MAYRPWVPATAFLTSDALCLAVVDEEDRQAGLVALALKRDSPRHEH
jgi:hypothetical protein